MRKVTTDGNMKVYDLNQNNLIGKLLHCIKKFQNISFNVIVHVSSIFHSGGFSGKLHFHILSYSGCMTQSKVLSKASSRYVKML